MRALEFQEIHTGGMRRILSPLQKPSLNERLERFGNLLHVVSDERSDLFVGQEGTRMSVQKDEQIEITAVLDNRNASEQFLQFCRPVAPV